MRSSVDQVAAAVKLGVRTEQRGRHDALWAAGSGRTAEYVLRRAGPVEGDALDRAHALVTQRTADLVTVRPKRRVQCDRQLPTLRDLQSDQFARLVRMNRHR